MDDKAEAPKSPNATLRSWRMMHHRNMAAHVWITSVMTYTPRGMACKKGTNRDKKRDQTDNKRTDASAATWKLTRGARQRFLTITADHLFM